MAYFSEHNYPPNQSCQVLDAQISSLRNDLADVNLKRTVGNPITIRKFLETKKIEFAIRGCSRELEEQSVDGTIDELSDRFITTEERIIIPVDRKRLVMLLSGSAIILVGLYFFTKKR